MRGVAETIVETWVGADGLPLQFAMKDSAGAAFSLTGYALTLTASLDGTAKMNAQTVSVTSAAAGLCEYLPTAAQINAAGDYKAIIWLATGGRVRPSRVFTIRVNAV